MSDKTNEEKFLEMLKIADPELFAVKELLILSRLNLEIFLSITKSISRISSGSGYGKVTINVYNNVVKNIIMEESEVIEQKIEVKELLTRER